MSEEEVLKRLAEIRGNINELQKYYSDEWIMREVLASMALSKDAPMTLTDMPRPWSEGDMQKKFVGVDKAHGEDIGVKVEGYWLNGVYTVTKEHRLTPLAVDGATVSEFCECGISIESHTGVYCIFRPATKA